MAFPAWQLLGSLVPCPGIRAVHSRRPTASEITSESATPGLWGKRLGLSVPDPGKMRGCRVSISYPSWRPVALPANPKQPVAARDAVQVARRRRGVLPPILQYSGAALRLGRLYVLRLFRLLLALAFDLEKSSDMMGARVTKKKRARTASIQTHGPCRARRK